jgi:hypothetical protein
MPRPPFFFGWHMSSQDLKAVGEVGLSSLALAHQNFLMMALILSTKVLKNRIVDM